jgi:hypothetical protein
MKRLSHSLLFEKDGVILLIIVTDVTEFMIQVMGLFPQDIPDSSDDLLCAE